MGTRPVLLPATYLANSAKMLLDGADYGRIFLIQRKKEFVDMALPLPITLFIAVAVLGSFAGAPSNLKAQEVTIAETIEAFATAGDPVVQVDAGTGHACALVKSGQVFCWGSNAVGQLGTDVFSSTGPVRVDGLNNVTQIAVGGDHSCGLRNDGRVFCWGFNNRGQLGIGTGGGIGAFSPVIVRAKLPPNAVQISAGDRHTCAVMGSGRVFCWGSTSSGRLGIGDINAGSSIPRRVVGPQLYEKISAGHAGTCALTRGRRAFCWGTNAFFALGAGSPNASENTPVRVLDLERLTQITTGRFHGCALREDGVAFCWGSNIFGQLGDGTKQTKERATRVKRLFDIKDIDTSFRHTCAIRENGTPVCWGLNLFGEVGDGTTTQRLFRQRVKRLVDATDMATGRDSTCAARQNGRAVCWGSNAFGQLGNGNTNRDPNPIRSRVKGLGN